MAVDTNGIASNTEVNAKIGSNLTPTNPDKLPTYTEIINTGKATITGSYSSNQLVLYSDISVSVTRETIAYNWGTFIPIYNASITIQNTYSLATEVIYFGGQTMQPSGGYSYSSHSVDILAGGSGNLTVIAAVINGSTWNPTNKVQLSAVTNLFPGTKPSTWNNSIGAYYLVSGGIQTKDRLKFSIK